ncbi:protein of unknown function [Proteiniborus ethanoligenes]|uniref:DUF1893 domain-containing protein n=1 Tax=Proteiniborus ethanoligenes TaxID=415015 RepID=A0A1H3MXU0_9FIRM|nr:DUF1893 domain-containing protein [Proteiniborus ethanoligenes]TAH64007.1 MAG: DUF1893 domain-containing protein [Gottschalkiaceae bacterium]SDY81537.1 protein of unknown function [Proteiniborus ethanoligenes]
MRDLELAKKLLEEKELTLAIVKEEKIIFTSKDKGIKPIYTAVLEMEEELKDASVADRVTGKAAAILCKYAGIKKLYTKLISQEAIKILQNSNMELIFEESSPYIKNREKTDMCPVEKLSLTTESPKELIQKIASFLDSIKKRS